MAEVEKCPGDPAHLGNPELVKWGGVDIGDNDTIKVPFVSKNVEYVRGYVPSEDDGGGTDRWIEKETWTLSGEIINCEGYKEIVESQQSLIDIFELDYQELEVGDLETLYYGRVVSINFGDSDYLNSTPYEVVIEGYRGIKDLTYDRKVINPVANYTWTENEDGTMDLTYNVSAQGIQTSDSTIDALENAKLFVNLYLEAKNFLSENESEGFGPFIAFNERNSEGARYVVSDEETIDRNKGSYGIKRTYRIDQTDNKYSVLRYTVDSMGVYGENKKITFDGYIEIGYDGEYDDNIKHLRERYYDFKESGKLVDPDTGVKLPAENAITERVEEDKNAGLLNFTLVFGDVEEGCVDDYDVSVDESAESSLISVKVNGQVFHKGPCPFSEVKKCFYGDYAKEDDCPVIDGAIKKYFAIAEEYYKRFLKDNTEVEIPDDVKLNSYPLEVRVSENPNDKVINYTLVFNDRISFGAHNFDYTLSVSPPVRQVSVNSFQEICTSSRFKPKCEAEARSHHYQDLGISSASTFGVKCTVEGSANDVPGGDVNGFSKKLRDDILGGAYGLKPLMIKNNRGGNQSNQTKGGEECEAYNTYEYEWILGKKKVAVNSDRNDRNKIVKLYFGR